MAKNRQHQWEPVPDTDRVKCSKCGTEVKATQARKGVGPCTWGEKTEPVVPEQIPGREYFVDAVSKNADGSLIGDDKTCDGSASAPFETVDRAREEATEQARIMRETNLCDTCTKQIAECGSNPKFGTGVGNDNVYECDGYIEGEKPAFPATEPPKYPGPRLTDPPEYCNACGEHIAILPLNSRLDMVACNNRRCNLYRERLRTVTKPVERGKRKKR